MPAPCLSTSALWLLLSAPGAPRAVPAAPPRMVARGTAPAEVPEGKRLDLQAVLDKVQARYDAATDFRASFSQTLVNPTFHRRTISSGEVLFKKPGRMRWNYTKPDPRMILSDGDRLWLWEPDDQQAFRQDLKTSQLPAALVFLTGRGQLTDEFSVSFASAVPYGTARDYVLALTPKKPGPQVKSLVFVVDPASFFVRETVVTDGQGNTNDLVFADVKTNTHIPDATFRWVPPAGTRVIDAAKLAHPE